MTNDTITMRFSSYCMLVITRKINRFYGFCLKTLIWNPLLLLQCAHGTRTHTHSRCSKSHSQPRRFCWTTAHFSVWFDFEKILYGAHNNILLQLQEAILIHSSIYTCTHTHTYVFWLRVFTLITQHYYTGWCDFRNFQNGIKGIIKCA